MLWLMITEWLIPICMVLIFGVFLSFWKKGQPPILLALLEFVVLGAGHIASRRYATGVGVLVSYFIILFAAAYVDVIADIQLNDKYMITFIIVSLLFVSFYSARAVKDKAEEQRMYRRIKKRDASTVKLLKSRGSRTVTVGTSGALYSDEQTSRFFDYDGGLLNDMFRQEEEQRIDQETRDNLDRDMNDNTNDHHYDHDY
ncbi:MULTISPECIES: hypothetical protein [unclassified Psychrobacillus]|uniref:hypothetical protein n=1 Tax=unclassified Psychrobacillus TaxID=2636677 RepID=UPI0030F952F9